MKPIIPRGTDSSISIDRLTIQEIIQIQTEFEEARRRDLLADLEDSGATSEERLKALRADRDASGNVAALLRLAFDPRWAQRICRKASKGDAESASWMDQLPAEELTRIALACLGADLDEMKAGGKTEGGKA